MAGEPKARTPNRWGEGGKLREEILRAAERLLGEAGREDALSLRAVAREVGIAPPSIYLHFKDRAELVATLMEKAYGEFIAELRAVGERHPADDPEGALRAMVLWYGRFALENPARYRLMFGVEQSALPVERFAGHPVMKLINVWARAFAACGFELEPHPFSDAGTPRAGSADGAPARMYADRRGALLWTALHGITTLRVALPVHQTPDDMPALADDLVTALLAG
ncbi:TetR/AcrR family transcriptional regulator [Streptomyces sp. NPDC087263]|uniref:TetR/AcrR family transcriptional regulator n=1 Tax=Streptomyces sp. NPDC087263 TaxID=3365773 RepID=UPI0037F1A7AD